MKGSAYLFLFFFLSCNHSCFSSVDEKSAPEHPSDLKKFFSSTYIEKVKGTWDITTNGYLYPCYKDGWSLFHLHHICIKGGQDGLVTGLNENDNDWSYIQNENKFIATNEEFNLKSQSPQVGGTAQAAGEIDPIKSIRVSASSVNDVNYIPGGTLFANCFQQVSDSANPAHWMMKLGSFYEIAQCEITNRNLKMSRPDLHEVHQFRVPWKPFGTLFMHQCPNPVVSGWKWGDNMFNMIRNKLVEAGILIGGFRYLNTEGYKVDSKQGEIFDLTCFEDIYLSNRNGIWMQKPYNLIQLRKDTAHLTGEPKEALQIQEKESETLPAPYCRKAPEKSTARIHVFQRSATRMLRRFTNLDEVVKLAQKYTSSLVQVVTVNASTSVTEQIRLFNNFDVLITPHGSHLANGIFSMHPGAKALIEIVPFAFDRVFYSNFVPNLGFAHYIMSTGHLTPQQEMSDGKHCLFKGSTYFNGLGCKKIKHNYPEKNSQEFYTCPSIYHTRMCDTQVDLHVLQTHLDDLFKNSLCRI